MEYEVRFYFPLENAKDIILKLKNIQMLEMKERCYEKTIQLDHPDENNTFYSEKVDGRFRVRITKSESSSKCKVSWKRRIKSTCETDVNKEEEVELTINYSEYDNLMYIINDVLKMKCIESYERYRTIFSNNEIEIALDEYPFGLALEIENKSINKDPEDVVKEWTSLIGLDIKKAYRLSWDDKYTELCKEQNVERFNHVAFNKPMPKVIE